MNVERDTNSSIGKDESEPLQFIHDIGVFDSEKSMHTYTSRFFDPATLNFECIYRWLRGRHRFLASFISSLICNPPDHESLILDNLVHRHASVWPTDDHDNRVLQVDAANLVVPVGETTLFSSLCNLKAISARLFFRETLLKLILNQYLRSIATPNAFSRDGISDEDFVMHGVARYIADQNERILIDEPLALHALMTVYETEQLSTADKRLETVSTATSADTGEKAVSCEELSALLLASFFGGGGRSLLGAQDSWSLIQGRKPHPV